MLDRVLLLSVAAALIVFWLYLFWVLHINERFQRWLWSKRRPKYVWHTFIGQNDSGWFACVAKTPGCVTTKYFPVKRLIHLGETEVHWDIMGAWQRACNLQKIAKKEGFIDQWPWRGYKKKFDNLENIVHIYNSSMKLASALQTRASWTKNIPWRKSNRS